MKRTISHSAQVCFRSGMAAINVHFKVDKLWLQPANHIFASGVWK